MNLTSIPMQCSAPHALLQRLVGVSLLALAGVAQAQTQTAVTKPVVERFEAIAQDGSVGSNAAVAAYWGGHQSRITRNSDGTIRVLYLGQRADAYVNWRLMKRDLQGKWTLETSGVSTDDVVLLRDPRDERPYVIAYPSGLPVVYTGSGTTFKATSVPGAWQALKAGSRHYGGAGVASDGTVCLKVSREYPATTETSNTNTEYSCGLYSASTGQWTWNAFNSHYIGNRHSYDYIFPRPKSLTTGAMYGVATMDVYKDASGIPAIDPNAFPYVFNGVRAYNTGVVTDVNTWKQNQVVAPIAKTSTTVAAPPTRRLIDSLIDSKGRMFTTYYQYDPLGTVPTSLRIAIHNADGTENTTLDGGSVLPSYGPARVFEDASGRLWVIWGAAGPVSQYMRVAQISETVSANGGPSVFKAPTTFTELGPSFYPYPQIGNLFIAASRGGNGPANYVDAVYIACNPTYKTGVNFVSSSCYNVTASQYLRVFYARIRLPD